MLKDRFRFATEMDNDAILDLINSTSMPGEIEVSLQTNPSFFKANEIKGRENQTICAMGPHNGLLGIGSRSIMPMFVNGERVNIGYLSDLKINPARSSGRLLFEGYKFLKNIHQDRPVPMHLTTVVWSNDRAKKILNSQRYGLPEYKDFGRFYCAIISIQKPVKREKSGIRVRRGNSERSEEILEFLSRQGKNKQFYPAYAREDFCKYFNHEHYDFSDFYMAYVDGKLKGVLAVWNQKSIKQIVVKRYNDKVRYLRFVYNVYCKLKGLPGLPKQGQSLNSCVVSFLAIESDDLNVFRELIWKVNEVCKGAKYHCFIVGLHEKDPKIKVIKAFAHRKYLSNAYLVAWKNEKDFLKKIDNRVPYLETGLL